MFMQFPAGLSSSSVPGSKAASHPARSGYHAHYWLPILSFALFLCSCTTINNRSFDFSSIPDNLVREKCDGQCKRQVNGNHPFEIASVE